MKFQIVQCFKKFLKLIILKEHYFKNLELFFFEEEHANRQEAVLMKDAFISLMCPCNPNPIIDDGVDARNLLCFTKAHAILKHSIYATTILLLAVDIHCLHVISLLPFKFRLCENI